MAPTLGESIRVLIIDDEEDTVAVVRALLRGRLEGSASVDWASSGVDGVHAIEQRRHDVCLIARELDRERGGDLVRGAALAGYAAVIVLRGHRDRSVERQVLEEGAADFIWKEELSGPLLDSALRHALDVRDRLRLERQLHLGQRLETIGQLAGGVAHEFNNILTAIVGFGTLLAERVAGDKAASSQVDEILHGADRATTLTRELLAFSRRQVLRPIRLNPAEVVEHISRMLRGVMGSRIELNVHCADHVPAIRADRAQIEHAITNLAINARDAMPNGGRLTIELDEVELDSAYCAGHVSAQPGRYLRLCVSDTGEGIEPERLPRVFEPFFNTRSSATSSGLGLSTVYGIVKQSGGNIWVYSEPGLGTTFKLYFPVDTSAPKGGNSVTPRPPEQTRGTETILLVDDADMVRRLARDILCGAGYRVLEAGGADEALQVAVNEPVRIDLLVTDVVMPGRNGVELAERLRTTRGGLPVLYISGYTDNSVVRDGLLAQEAAFLQKPFTPEALLRKVRQILEAA